MSQDGGVKTAAILIMPATAQLSIERHIRTLSSTRWKAAD